MGCAVINKQGARQENIACARHPARRHDKGSPTSPFASMTTDIAGHPVAASISRLRQ
jgi:hypothetical protein